MTRAKPEDWWRIRPMGDGVTHIDEPHIREFYRCNVWHVRGRDTDMLVDSGMGAESGHPEAQVLVMAVPGDDDLVLPLTKLSEAHRSLLPALFG